MLTIAKGTNDADVYFSKDNYYTVGEGLEHSQWRGQGAEYLGLEGRIHPDQFNALLRGEVDGTRLGRVVKGERKHRSGWDLTFSAPKSLSILSEVYGVDDLRLAHEKAVEHALTACEDLLDTRLTQGGKTQRVATNNGVFATFTHDVNRNLDCQLHTHCYLLNMTRSAHGWRSLYTERLFASQRKKQLGQVYRSALAVLLKDAGYDLVTQRDPSLFEIKGVPQGLMDEFSTRSKEIEDWFKTNKIPYDPVMAKTVALMSRKSKKAVPRAELFPIWQERAAPYGFDPAILKIDRPSSRPVKQIEPTKQIKTSTQTKEAVAKALQHLSEREMGFTHETLKKDAQSFGLGEVLFVDIEKEVARLTQRGDLLPARQDSENVHIDKQLWTTPAMKALEASLVQAVGQGRGIGKPLVKADYAEKRLLKTHLNDQQRQAILASLASVDRFAAIQGDPGVGKTTALKEYKAILSKKGYEVLAMAPNYQAVSELSSSLGITGMTVDRYLADPNSKKLGRALKQQVWIVDEASMLATDRVVALMEKAKERKARVLFVGDHQQLEAVGIGRGFKHLLEAGVDVSLLNQWLRPKTEVMKEAFKLVIDKDYGGTIGLLSSAGNVLGIEKEHDAIEGLSKQWLGMDSKERAATQIIAPTNEQCQAINHAVRSGLKERGDIGKTDYRYGVFTDKHMTEEQRCNVPFYQAGDVLRFSSEHLAVGKKKRDCIARNEYFGVIGLNKETNTLALKSKKTGRTLFIDPAKTGGRQAGGIQVFNPHTIEVSSGDKLRWLDNSNQLGLKRNTELTVKRLSDKWIRVETNKGESLKLPLDDLKHMHFDHNYAKTAYGVQGATKTRVIALMNSWRINTTNARSFMVAVTRATHDITIYTDSEKRLIDGLNSRTGNNTEALTKPEFTKAVERAKPAPPLEKERARQRHI